MDPISNVDAIVLLLRQRLLERSRANAARPEVSRPARAGPPPVHSDTLHELAAIQGIDDRQLGRALVQSVLAEHFGAKMINEPAFQQVVERVAETLQEEPESATLLQRMVRELRVSSR